MMTQLISLVQHLGYIGLFCIVVFESGVPVTFFLPGDSLLFTMGYLASQGHFNIFILIPVFFAAGVLGYLGGYIIGKKLGEKLFVRENSFWFNPKRLQYAKDFFEKYGTKTILLGRFVPVVRSFAATVAGAADMKYKKFIAYTVIGALIWSVGMTTLGFYLGHLIPHADSYLTPIIALIVFVSVLPTIIEYIVKRRKNKKVN